MQRNAYLLTCNSKSERTLFSENILKNIGFNVKIITCIPHNDKVIAASGELDKMAQGLNAQYQKGEVSTMFCKIKFEGIEKSAETMQQTIGAKPR